MILGIDPGVTGCVAAIERGVVSFYDTPTITVKKGKRTKLEYLPAQMTQDLELLKSRVAHCFIEKVHSMPDQGSVSTFGFGMGFGLWIGILCALHIPYTFVTPQAWKKELMQGMRDKDAARIRAQQLFPQTVDRLSRKMDVGRADALLIAEYGRRTYVGKK
jgi:crossover junction endodeoxyribonuclease RuvC